MSALSQSIPIHSLFQPIPAITPSPAATRLCFSVAVPSEYMPRCHPSSLEVAMGWEIDRQSTLNSTGLASAAIPTPPNVLYLHWRTHQSRLLPDLAFCTYQQLNTIV